MPSHLLVETDFASGDGIEGYLVEIQPDGALAQWRHGGGDDPGGTANVQAHAVR
jgi:hypothetical protein